MASQKHKQPAAPGARLSRTRLASSARRSYLFLLVALTLHAGALKAPAQDRLTKLDPESLVVRLEDGRGMADVVISLGKDVAAPDDYKVTAAVGSSNTIPASHITFKWTKPESAAPDAAPASAQPTSEQPRAQGTLLTGRLSVQTDVSVQPDTNYVGHLIFIWRDGATQKMQFTVTDNATLAFSLDPTKLELTLVHAQPDSIQFRVKNTGRAPIRKLNISSLGLLDSETQRRLEPLDEPTDFGSAPLAPSQEMLISLKLKHPVWAGTYVGTLDVTANGRPRQAIAVTVRTRGPVPRGGAYWVPFILFIGTLLLGYLLSTKLENWFNLGGLQRAEAQLSLQKSEVELARVAKRVDKLGEERPPSVFARARLRLRQDLGELRELLPRIPGLTRDDLTAEAKRFTHAAAAAVIFESAVNVALSQFTSPPGNLNDVLTSLGREEPGSDLNDYRTRLRKVLSDAVAASDNAEAFDAVAVLPDTPAPADLESQIRFMARLERAVAAAVVFIMAYQLYYARDYSFGTLLDYLTVFLWSLGLTQMGTQIISRARSSFTPSR